MGKRSEVLSQWDNEKPSYTLFLPTYGSYGAGAIASVLQKMAGYDYKEI